MSLLSRVTTDHLLSVLATREFTELLAKSKISDFLILMTIHLAIIAECLGMRHIIMRGRYRVLTVEYAVCIYIYGSQRLVSRGQQAINAPARKGSGYARLVSDSLRSL